MRSHHASPYHLIKIGLLANIAEWYEFSIYAYLASTIGRLFFCMSGTPILELTQAFALFAVSALARPFGGLFFGVCGDKQGRKYALQLSLMMMSIPTILIGLLPTYATIGYSATVLLLMLRIIQSFAAGGEFPVNACYVFEKAPLKHRTLLSCTVAMSNVAGFLFGSIMSALLDYSLTQEQLNVWGWRIPFLLGIPLTYWIFLIRNSLEETQSDHLALTQTTQKIIAKLPIRHVLVGVGLMLAPLMGTYVISLWIRFYLAEFLHYPIKTVSLINNLALLSTIPFSFFMAWLTQFIPIRTLLGASSLSLLLFSYPLFIGLQAGGWLNWLIVLVIFKFLVSGTGGIILEVLGRLFKQARSTGMSLTFTLPTALLGGMTPVICTYMTQKWGLNFPAFYCMFLAFLSSLAVYYCPPLDE